MAKIFSKFRKGILKTREQVFGKISTAITRRRKIDDDLLEEIEEILIGGDVGVDTTLKIIEQVKMRIKKEKYEDAQDLFKLLQEEMAKILPEKTTDFLSEVSSSRPYIILVVGVNGVGKTTFIAKLAHLLKREGKSILLVAADTFRAAAIEQLQIWAERVGVDLVRHQSGSDPGAVVFDALNAAKARGTDVVIIDTAGRLHTKVNLMEELKKIKRVMQKSYPATPHQTLLVLDANIGQNALNQARQFIEAVGIDGIVLTKLDGTAKGGAVIGVSNHLNIPVKFVGVGEGIDDLEEFDPQVFVSSLFEVEENA